MKHIYFYLLLAFSFGNIYGNNNLFALSASISGTANVCQNSGNQIITFTASGGTAPYTFTYKINGGADLKVTTTGSNDAVSVSVSTSIATTLTYTLVSLHDSTTPIVEQIITGQTASINIITVGVATPATLVACLTNTSQTSAEVGLLLSLPSNPSLIQTIKINWGDGSVAQNIPSSNWNIPIYHTYSLGSYNVVITSTTSLGCTIVRNYNAFIGSSPQAATLSLFANQATGCSPHNTQFTFGLPVSNSDGTNYKICFGDSTNCINYIEGDTIPSDWVFSGSTSQFNYYTITHIYNITSCGNTVNLNGSTYNNVFLPSVITTNPCTAPQPQAGSLISVGIAPTANFTPNPIQNVCVNIPFQPTNTSDFGGTIDSITYSCSSTSPFYWMVSSSTGGVWTATGLGSNNGSPNNELFWNTGSITPSITFKQAGNYTITLFVKNSCGLSSISHDLCVEPPLVPLFTLNTNSGCTPVNVTATNNTIVTNQCSPPIYEWSVLYTAANCGSGTISIPIQNTKDASYNFTQPGNYAITLKTTNDCGSNSTTQTVVVKKPPTASIASINDFCGTANINPSATVNNCVPTNSPLTYAWSFPGGIPATANTLNPGTINYATDGNYTVSLVVTNECGVSNTATQTFSVNPAATITNTSFSQTICSGSQTAAVTLTANPVGTTFAWTATATSGVTGFSTSGNTNIIPAQTISTTNTSVGTVTYVITPTFGSCVGTKVNYVVSVNPAPKIITQPASTAVCIGGIPTILAVTLSSSSVIPTYQWYSNNTNSTSGGTLIAGATTDSYNPPIASAGTLYYYCILSFISGGCSTLTSAIATVTVNPLPTIDTQPLATKSICVGGTVPAFTVSYKDGIGTATYQWYSNITNSTIGGTAVGTNSSNFTPPIFTSSGTFYYYATVTLSGSGCGKVTSNIAEVVVVNDPTVTAPLAAQTLCSGSTAADLSVTANGGIGTFNYQWYSNITNNNSGGTLISGATNNIYKPNTSVAGTLYYYCVITQADLGCGINSAVAKVEIVPAPIITTQPQSSSICTGGTPTLLTVSFTNGTGTPTYQWYDTNGVIAGATANTYLPSNTVAMDYYCILTFSSGGCTNITSATATVNISPLPIIDKQPLATQKICVGGLISAFTVSYADGVGVPTYQWYSNITNATIGGTAVGTNSPIFTPPIFTSSGTFYYYATVTLSGSGCGKVTSNIAEVIVVADPIVSAPLTSQSLCSGTPATDLSITATGGIGTFSYQWYSNTANNNTGGNLISGATTDTYTPDTTTAGTWYYYCVISQPEIGCGATSAVAKVEIVAAPIITKQPQSDSICEGGNPTLLTVAFTNGTGTPTYQWFSNVVDNNFGGNPIIGANASTYLPENVNFGTLFYYCEITFSTGGCSLISSNTAEVFINQIPVVTNQNVILCSGDTLDFIPQNGNGNTVPTNTMFTWNLPVITPTNSIFGATSQTIPQSNFSQTLINNTDDVVKVVYTVTPMASICTGNTFTIEVLVFPKPDVIFSESNQIICDQSISKAVNFSSSLAGTVNFNWTANIPSEITGAIASGTNTIPPQTLTNSSTVPLTVSYIAAAMFDYNGSSCSGEPYVYEITVNPNFQGSGVISNYNGYGVSYFGSSDGFINLTVNGGAANYTYDWVGPNGFVSNLKDLTGIPAGNYTVTINDGYCNPIILPFILTQPPELLFQEDLNAHVNLLCFGYATGSLGIKITQESIAPYDFQLVNELGTIVSSITDANVLTQVFNNLLAGIYSVVITDGNGGIKKLQGLEITQPNDIIITPTKTAISCYGANDATLTLTVTGGTAPYTAMWDNLATGFYQDNLSAGNYTITITDGNGCAKPIMVNIPEAPVFKSEPIVKNISCFGANDGSINLNLTGGIAPVKLVWSDGSTAGLIRNNLTKGDYTAIISDGTPCYITKTFTIIEPQSLVLEGIVTNALDCTNPNSGAIDLLVSGGTQPYTYSWSNGITTEDLNNITSGNYLVTVTDFNGCQKMAEYTITRPPPIDINIATETDFNCDTHTVSQKFVAQVSGGLPPFNLQWSSGKVSGANNEMMQTEVNGTVILTITDSYGCVQTKALEVNTPVLGYASFETNSIGYATFGIYSVEDPIQFQSTITGDYVSIAWNFGDGTFSTEENPIHTYVNAKDYVVTQTVTYPFGCVYVYKITLTVEKGYVFVAPTGFTPNNDGVNDTYRPVTNALKKVHLDVYDTWGALIYSETGDDLRGWNGTIKGENAENGNYFAQISAETFYGLTVKESTTFTLIK